MDGLVICQLLIYCILCVLCFSGFPELNYVIGKCIGSGACGMVYEASRILDGKKVVHSSRMSYSPYVARDSCLYENV